LEYCVPQALFAQLKHSAELMLPSGALQLPDPAALSPELPQATMNELNKLQMMAIDFFMTAE